MGFFLGPFNLEKGFVSAMLQSPGVNTTIVYGSQLDTVVSADYADYSFSEPLMEYTASGSLFKKLSAHQLLTASFAR